MNCTNTDDDFQNITNMADLEPVYCKNLRIIQLGYLISVNQRFSWANVRYFDFSGIIFENLKF